MGKGGNYDTIPFGQGVRADTSMPFLLLDNSKTKTIMNFMPVISLESGIQTYL
jgi:hypothetical protein